MNKQISVIMLLMAAAVVAACSSAPVEQAPTVDPAQSEIPAQARAHFDFGHGPAVPGLNERAADLNTAQAVPYFSYFGGAIDGHAEIIPIYWGPNVSFASDLDGFYASIASSDFVSGLAGDYSTQDSKIEEACFGGSTTDPASPPATVSDEQVKAEILALAENGTIAAPNGKRVYLVHLPAGVTSTISGNGLPPGFTLRSCRHYCAYHLSFVDPTSGQKAFYSVIPDQTGGASCARCAADPDLFDNTTRRASHQVAVDITDPDSVLLADTAAPTAWLDHTSFGEIADGACEAVTGEIGPYTVDGWFSNKRGACVTSADVSARDFTVVPAQPLVTLKAGATATVHVGLATALPSGISIPVRVTTSAGAGITATVLGSGFTSSTGGVDIQFAADASALAGEVPVTVTATSAAATGNAPPVTNFSKVFVTVTP